MPIYTELRPGATKRPAQNLSKHCDAFAKAALGEVFRARDLCLAREPDCQDPAPSSVGGVMSAPIPKGFSPAEFPILAVHWFGLDWPEDWGEAA